MYNAQYVSFSLGGFSAQVVGGIVGGVFAIFVVIGIIIVITISIVIWRIARKGLLIYYELFLWKYINP